MQDLGVLCTRYFATLLPLLLEMAAGTQLEVRNAALSALIPFVKASWPRMADHAATLKASLSHVSLPLHAPAISAEGHKPCCSILLCKGSSVMREKERERLHLFSSLRLIKMDQRHSGSSRDSQQP
jgi:hypothetical protein